MKLRKTFLYFSLALMVGALTLANAVSAATTTYNATLTGYTYEGGAEVYTSSGNASGENVNSDYFVAGPQKYIRGADTYAYSWLKFEDIGTQIAESAYLTLELIGVGSATDYEDVTGFANGLLLDATCSDIDVAEFVDNADALTETRRQINQTMMGFVNDVVMLENGIYTIDITSVYNYWVTGDIENTGLLLYTDTDNYESAIFASTSGKLGVAPTLTVSAVPVPGAVWLLGSGLVGLIGLRRRS
jgi:hypothetical protein